MHGTTCTVKADGIVTGHITCVHIAKLLTIQCRSPATIAFNQSMLGSKCICASVDLHIPCKSVISLWQRLSLVECPSLATSDVLQTVDNSAAAVLYNTRAGLQRHNPSCRTGLHQTHGQPCQRIPQWVPTAQSIAKGVLSQALTTRRLLQVLAAETSWRELYCARRVERARSSLTASSARLYCCSASARRLASVETLQKLQNERDRAHTGWAMRKPNRCKVLGGML